jgi:putative hydrolase of the HAD superfamily
MTECRRDIIRRHSRPLVPLTTDQQPVLRELRGVRAVLFDIYGTLIVSGSGDVGSAAEGSHSQAFAAAVAAMGLAFDGGAETGARVLQETILHEHERLRRRGVDHPEVDICEIWRLTLDELGRQGRLGQAGGAVDLERLALEYEVRVNPVWPMPDAAECLEDLRRARLTLGLVSNAQFFTRELFPALLGKTLEELGFDPELQFYSYCYGQAKPGRFLHQLAARALAGRGLEADEILYLGNDMLNDVAAARAVGFRTALFAGDARSLRRREDDPRVRGVSPDIVITRLSSLPQCLAARDDSETD